MDEKTKHKQNNKYCIVMNLKNGPDVIKYFMSEPAMMQFAEANPQKSTMLYCDRKLRAKSSISQLQTENVI